MADDLQRARKIRLAGEQANKSRIQIITEIRRDCDVSAMRAHRLYLGTSAEALADKLQISRSQLQRIETGKHEPKNELLDRICRALHTNPIRLGLFADYTPDDERQQPDSHADDSDSTTRDTVETGHDASREEDPTDRRDMLAGLAATPLGVALQKLRLASERLFSELSRPGARCQGCSWSVSNK